MYVYERFVFLDISSLSAEMEQKEEERSGFKELELQKLQARTVAATGNEIIVKLNTFLPPRTSVR